MESETVNKLLEINRIFYSRFSDDFSDSRSGERFNIEPFRHYVKDGMRLLDVGCGNGRLAGTLERAGFALDYVGVDGSTELVAFAKNRTADLRIVRAEFHVVDLTLPGWGKTVAQHAPYDGATSLAVLHHIPGFDLRVRVLSEIRSLLRPGGVFVMSNWQFTESDRLRKKIVDWSHVELDPSQMDPNDYLLDWKRGGTGYRYVHLITECEVAAMAQSAQLTILAQFRADNDLNLYSILHRSLADGE